MKKRLCSLLLAALLALGAMPSALAGYEYFVPQASYAPGQFTDVPEDAWYAPNVRAAYEYGLIDGTSATTFTPDAPLKVAEAVKLAVCLHQIYHTGQVTVARSQPWYQSYVEQALQSGILAAPRSDYTAPATRAVFASVLAAALPAQALPAINTVPEGAIPDVAATASYAPPVYLLYRAGVLTGVGDGRFLPHDTIKRSEAAAIVTRMADPGLRRSVALPAQPALTADEIYARCLPAVFKLYAYDSAGRLQGKGSGVVLSPDGDAVTCGHLVNGVYRLVAEMADGVKREVSVYELDTSADIAHIRVVGSRLPYLERAAAPQVDDVVFALGYPGGGAARVTEGRVLDPADTSLAEYGVPLIESTASIISGNSGGALLDGQGELLGVTVSSYSGGSPSYTVPIDVLDRMSAAVAVSPADYAHAHRPDAALCYDRMYPVPDFGVLLGVPLLGSERDRGTTCFYYRQADLPPDAQQQYYAALNAHTFYQFSGGKFTSSAGYLYAVKLSETTYQGTPALAISVSGTSARTIGGLPTAAGLFSRQRPGAAGRSVNSWSNMGKM
ncbi:MAG: S-layer homology domain-containing protein [Eubacteriales bacterium]|nr:S-layer homology domain-containing protein [Eubacteriales bacterium]